MGPILRSVDNEERTGKEKEARLPGASHLDHRLCLSPSSSSSHSLAHLLPFLLARALSPLTQGVISEMKREMQHTSHYALPGHMV